MATAAAVAEEIFRMYYKFAPQQDSDLDERDVLFHVFNGACKYAVTDAQINSKADEGYYSNDAFYLKYTLPVLTDVGGRYYVSLPSAPVSLAGNREIDHVFFPGANCTAIFVSAKQRSYIAHLPKIPGIQWYLSDGKMFFNKNGLAKLLTTVSFDIICAGNNPLSELNMPANYIPLLVQDIVKMLLVEKGLTVDLSNDKVDN